MITSFLGLKPNSGEYKVMGLAPFGKPIHKEKLNELFEWNHVSDDEFPGSHLNLKVLNPVWPEEKNLSSIERHLEHQRRRPESPLLEYYADIAASLQALTNEYMLEISNSAARITKAKNLVMAGGVALNCVSNEYIKRNGNFEKIWIQPASGDAGGSIGAAYALQAASQSTTIQIEQINDMYLGREFTREEISESLTHFGITLKETRLEEVLDAACKDLGDNKIIGWFRGRSEFGPRALGNRSILGRPDSSSMQVRMNLKIKFRESFRPFAPVIMSEYYDDYFDGERDPFMIRIAKTRDFLESELEIFDIRKMLDQQRSTLQATTHLDGTARVQSVEKSSNPELHSLIEKFYELTGLPVLINTSFNTRGEPIVYCPKDALIAFARTEIDTLYLGNFIVRRADINENLRRIAGKVMFDAD
jgi:carbamoyltransferase